MMIWLLALAGAVIVVLAYVSKRQFKGQMDKLRAKEQDHQSKMMAFRAAVAEENAKKPSADKPAAGKRYYFMGGQFGDPLAKRWAPSIMPRPSHVNHLIAWGPSGEVFDVNELCFFDPTETSPAIQPIPSTPRPKTSKSTR